MATRVRVELNSDGVKELLKSPEVEEHLAGLASIVEGAAVSGAPVETGRYRDSIYYETEQKANRVIAIVATSDPAGRLIEAKTGNLARALDAIGGASEETRLVDYVTKSGKKRKATQRQVDNWTRGSS